jgi:ComF family protein
MSICRADDAIRLLKNWAGGIAGDCLLCGATAVGEAVCAACESQLPRSQVACERCALPLPMPGTCGACLRRPPVFARALAAYEYRFPVDRMVGRFKYRADFATGAWLARRLAARCEGEPRPELLVAPPLTRRRLRERGFNQAGELARIVGSRLDIRHQAALLERVREVPPQQALGAQARRANLHGAFRCTRRLHGEPVAIVDDVVTTGATAEALAHVLLAGGAGSVALWAVARTPAPGG